MRGELSADRDSVDLVLFLGVLFLGSPANLKMRIWIFAASLADGSFD